MSVRRRLVDAGHVLRVIAAVLSDAYVRPLPRAGDGPLVTVLIPAYNRSEVLRYALARTSRSWSSATPAPTTPSGWWPPPATRACAG